MLIWIFVILVLCCIFDYSKNHKIFTPIFIFNFIWLITLSLYELKLSYLQSDLSERTIEIFMSAVLAYDISYIFFNIFNNKKTRKTEKLNDNYIKKKIKLAKIILLSVFVLEVAYSGGVPLLWKFIGSSKNYISYGIPSLHGAFNGLLICLGAYNIYKKRKESFVYILIGILILSRQVIISMFIEAIMCMILDPNKKLKKKNKRKIILYVVLLLSLFTILGNFRSGNNTMNNVFKPKEEYENLSDTTKWVYSYMTFSISNFNNLTRITDGNINKGASMLNELLPTVLLEKVNINTKYKVFYLVSLNYTVSTYMPPIYLDYGKNGIIIFSVFMAFIGCLFYKKYEKNKESIKNKLLYSVFIHNVLLLFFSNMFLYLPIIVQFIYIPIIFDGGIDRKKSE